MNTLGLNSTTPAELQITCVTGYSGTIVNKKLVGNTYISLTANGTDIKLKANLVGKLMGNIMMQTLIGKII